MNRSGENGGGGGKGTGVPVDWYANGLILMSRGDLEQASECFEKALQEEPHNESAWFNWGVVLGRMGLHDEAMLCYDTAVKVGEVDSKEDPDVAGGETTDPAEGAGGLQRTMEDISSGNFQGVVARTEVDNEDLYFGHGAAGADGGGLSEAGAGEEPGRGGRPGDGLVPGPKRKVARKRHVKGVRPVGGAPPVKAPVGTPADDPLSTDVDRALESLREEDGGCVYMELNTKLMLHSSVRLVSYLTGPKGMKGVFVTLTSPAQFYSRLAVKSGVDPGDVLYIDASGAIRLDSEPSEGDPVYVDTQDNLMKLKDVVEQALDAMGSRYEGVELFVLFDDGAALTLFHPKSEVKQFFIDFTKYAADRKFRGFILMRTDSLAETMEEYAEGLTVVSKESAGGQDTERERA